MSFQVNKAHIREIEFSSLPSALPEEAQPLESSKWHRAAVCAFANLFDFGQNRFTW